MFGRLFKSRRVKIKESLLEMVEMFEGMSPSERAPMIDSFIEAKGWLPEVQLPMGLGAILSDIDLRKAFEDPAWAPKAWSELIDCFAAF